MPRLGGKYSAAEWSKMSASERQKAKDEQQRRAKRVERLPRRSDADILRARKKRPMYSESNPSPYSGRGPDGQMYDFGPEPEGSAYTADQRRYGEAGQRKRAKEQSDLQRLVKAMEGGVLRREDQQSLSKAMEGGVLRKEDEDKYRKFLRRKSSPNLQAMRKRGR